MEDASRAGVGRDLRVLLVDDDAVDVMTVERVIRTRRMPVRLDSVSSGEEAIARLEGSLACDPSSDRAAPDVLLVDLHLPLMSGHELLHHVQADGRLAPLPCLVVSTSSRRSDVEQAYRGGASGYLVKVLDFEEFADAFEATVRYWRTSLRPSFPLESVRA